MISPSNIEQEGGEGFLQDGMSPKGSKEQSEKGVHGETHDAKEDEDESEK